jgi:hypothetical protein
LRADSGVLKTVVGCWLLVAGKSKGKGRDEIRRFWLRQNDELKLE